MPGKRARQAECEGDAGEETIFAILISISSTMREICKNGLGEEIWT